MVAALQQPEFADHRRKAMQLLTARGIDELIVSAGENQEWELDLTRMLEDSCASPSPFGVEPARDLVVDERIGAIRLDDLGNPRQGAGIDLVVKGQLRRHHR